MTLAPALGSVEHVNLRGKRDLAGAIHPNGWLETDVGSWVFPVSTIYHRSFRSKPPFLVTENQSHSSQRETAATAGLADGRTGCRPRV